MRAIGQAFGMDIAWDQDSNAAYVGVATDAGAPQKQIRVYVDGNLLQPKDVNGKSVPPIAMEGTVYLPVRALSQALGCSVAWDQGTRTVTMYSENTYHAEPWRLIFMGNWSLVQDPAAMQKQAAEQFALAAKSFARWGIAGIEPHTVSVTMKADFHDKEGSTRNAAAYSVSAQAEVFLRADQAAKEKNYVGNHLLHEFTHCTQTYHVDCSWWKEHIANYTEFRYYASPAGKTVLKATDSAVRDWNWAPYGRCEWFLAWVDDNWPTRQTSTGLELGLLDRLHFALQYDEVEGDGGQTHTDPDFNAIVRAYTGASSMEELRQRYVRELDSGAWTFYGFDGMEDSFLTDGINVNLSTRFSQGKIGWSFQIPLGNPYSPGIKPLSERRSEEHDARKTARGLPETVCTEPGQEVRSCQDQCSG